MIVVYIRSYFNKGHKMADIKQIAEKIEGAKNILVALPQNPNVDEVSAALGLTLMLDKLGKKATAIYSGETPAMLKFLNPEKTFSTDTNALQDFIISLDKDKADHLRYKVDGDFVKVFITPYREAISENDLEYSYGEFNVDLIIALDVADERDLDSALIEYGRIMHDAGAVNITIHEGGKFSEMEWSNPGASSVSEMVAELGAEISPEAFEKNSATALLTGIVASTERFANEKTTPETMGVASKLMGAGADQILVAENIKRAENGKEQIAMEELPKAEIAEEPKIEEAEPEPEKSESEMPEPESAKSELEKPEPEPEKPEPEPEKSEPEPEKPVLETPSELLEGAPTEEAKSEEPSAGEPKVEEPKAEEEASAEEPKVEESKPEEAPAEEPKIELKGAAAGETEDTRRKTVTLQPSAEAQAELEEIMKEEPKKNEALDEINKYTGDQAVSGGLKPDVGLSNIDTDSIGKREVKDYGEMMAEALNGDDGIPNPAVQAAPAVATGPEANHIPEMDYSQASAAQPEQPPVMENGMLESVKTEQPVDILPPPPAPPVDGAIMPPGTETSSAPAPEPAPAAGPMPVQPVVPVTPVVPQAPSAPEAPAATEAPAVTETPAQPETPAQVGPTPTNDDPAAFRIPGM